MLHSPATPDAQPFRLKQAVTRLVLSVMQPLARILLRNGMSCQEFTEICRWSFVNAVLNGDEFWIEGHRPTKSRVSVLTGLSRKEVQRLMELPHPEEKYEKPSSNRAARVLDGWMSDPLYCDNKTGKPADLILQGVPPSFADLVKRYSGDVPFRAVLDELLYCGSVAVEDDAKVKLLNPLYLPPAGSIEQVGVVTQSLGDFFTTIEHNMRPDSEEKYAQMNTYSAHIPAQALSEFRTYSKRALKKFAEDYNFYCSEKFAMQKPEQNENHRAGIGLYYFEN